MSRSEHKVAVDPVGMRRRNESLLLRLIWSEREISRADIARQTRLSPSTVSGIVGDLESRGLVIERGTGSSRGGRRPKMVGFRDEAFHLIGIEIGASHVTAVVSTVRGEVLSACSNSHTMRTDPQGTLSLAFESIDECLAQSRVRRDGLVGIGMAVPSPVDPAAPGHLSPFIYPAWRDVDVQAVFEERFFCPVFVENDANAGALAEHWWGDHQSAEDLTYIKIATGIGSGHIVNGHLYRGAGGTAGEIGHMTVAPDGPRCLCGLDGCLVTMIGTETLLERAKGHISASNSDNLHINDIVDAAQQGEREALALIDEVGHYLGIAVAGLLNLMNPATVVIGGEITEVGDLLVDPLRASVKQRALFTSVARTRIVTSRLGQYAIAVGGTASVLDAALADPTLFPSSAKRGAA